MNEQLKEPDTIFPAKLYIFNEDGTYFEPITIISKEQLNGPGTKMIIREAIASKREVMLTDPSDFCVFHAKDGKVIYPPELKEK